MRPSSFHYVVISYFTALTVKAQENPQGLCVLHTRWGGRRKEGQADRQEETTPLHQPPPTRRPQWERGPVLFSETNSDSQTQQPEEALSPGERGRDHNRTGREEPPRCHALTRSQIQTELASGHRRNCYYKFRWCTRGCLIFYYCGWSREPLQQ